MDAADRLAEVEARAAELRAAQAAAQAARHALADAIRTAAAAGSPQRAIADRAGVSQPYVSQVLATAPRFMPRSPLGRRLLAKRAEVLRVVRSYGADNVVVFGSVASGTDEPGSDVDLMVDIPPGMGLFTLGRMEQDLRGVLGVDVDLIPARLAQPHVLASAARVAVPL